MKTRFNLRWHVCLLVFACSALAVTSAFAQNANDDYAQAANHYARGNWSASAAAFQDLLQRYPGSGEAVLSEFYLAEIMMQQSEFDRAYRAYQVFRREHPHHQFADRATFRMAESAYRTDHRDVAIRLFEDFIKRNPNDPLNEYALPYLGEMRLKQDEPQLAQRAFETALRIYPASSISNTSRMGLGKSLMRLGNDAEAIRFFQFLQTQGDRDLVGESQLQLGIMSFGNSDYASAEKQLSGAIANCQSAESQSEATYWLARTLNETKSHQHALELLQSIVDVELPERLAVATLFDGAVAATRTGDERLALRWLKRLRDRYPNNALADEALKMAIDLHQQRNESDQMLALIEQFLRLHPHSRWRASVLDAQGRAQYAAKQYEQMVETFSTLVEENEASKAAENDQVANWHYLMGLGYLGLAEYEAAERALLKIDPDEPSDQLAQWIPRALATALYGQQDYSSAIVHYRTYLKNADPGKDQKRARAELVNCLAETEQWDAAGSELELLKREQGNDPVVLSTATFLAELLFHKNEYDKAERWFALMAQPENPPETIVVGLSGLAWIRIESDANDDSDDVYKRLLTEFPDYKQVGETTLARAKFLEDDGELESAAATYRMVIRHLQPRPVTHVAKLQLAYLLQKIGGESNLEECETLLRAYLELPSGNPLADEAQYQLGWVLRDLGRNEEGLSQFAELVETDPASKYWADSVYRVIHEAVGKQTYDVAKPLVARALSRSDVPSHVMARILFAQGQIAAAENDWANVTDSMRRLASTTGDEAIETLANYWLSESLYRTEQYEDALIVLIQLLEEIQRLDESLEPWVVLRAAQCQGFVGDWDKAGSMASEGQQAFPDFEADYEFAYVAGRGLEDAGKLVDARDAYQTVVDSERGKNSETAAMAQWRIGETYFHQEDYVNAIKAYHKVDSLFTYKHWRSAALFQAGKCQELLNNLTRAIKLYTQLIDSFPESEFAIGARKRLDHLTAQAKSNGVAQPDPQSPNQNRR